jgi:hypothetical protein
MRQNLRLELLRAVAASLAEEVGLQGVLDDLALVHEDDAVRHLAGKELVGGLALQLHFGLQTFLRH